MRSYALHRPIGPFTWPSEHHEKVAEIVNWNHMQYVPEIRRNAFGYIEWTELPPMEDLRRYELMVPPVEDATLERIGGILANFERRERWESFEKAWSKAQEKYGYSDNELGDAWTRHSQV